MSRETLKTLIELVPQKDIETIYNIIIKFIPEVPPELDEIEAIAEAKADTSKTIPHDEINWD